jgi:hypothetical protein
MGQRDPTVSLGLSRPALELHPRKIPQDNGCIDPLLVAERRLLTMGDPHTSL